jgi:hypothetical protein
MFCLYSYFHDSAASCMQNYMYRHNHRVVTASLKNSCVAVVMLIWPLHLFMHQRKAA